MAFEDLIFRMRAQGGQLRRDIQRAVQSAVRTTVDASVRVNLQVRVPRDAIRKGLDLESVVRQSGRRAERAASRATGRIRDRLERELGRAGRSAGSSFGRGLANEISAAVRQAGNVRPTGSGGRIGGVRGAGGAGPPGASIPPTRRGAGGALPFDPRPVVSATNKIGGSLAVLAERSNRARTALSRIQRIEFGPLRSALTSLSRFRIGRRALGSLIGGLRTSESRVRDTAAAAVRLQVLMRRIGSLSLRGLSSAFEQARSGAARFRGAVGSAFSRTVSGARRAARAVGSLSRSFAILTSGGFLAGGAALLPVAAVRGVSSAVRQLADFTDQVNQSITLFSNKLTQLKGADRVAFVNKQFGELSRSVLDVGSRSGIAFNQVSEGLFDIISAGVGVDDIKERIDALNISANVAVGGVTNMRDAFRGVLGLARPFKIAFEEAGDALFAIQRLGIAPIAELSTQVGRVAPLAAAAGVSVQELGAAISTATAQGLPLNTVITGLRQTFAIFAKKGSKSARDELARLAKTIPGLSLALDTAKLKQIGLTGALREFSKIQQSDLGLIVRRVRALVPLIAIVRARAKFERDLGQIQKSGGEAAAAAAVRQQSLRVSLDRARNSIQAFIIAVTEQIARAIDLRGIVDRLTSSLQGMANAIRGIPATQIKTFVDNLFSLRGFKTVVDAVIRSAIIGVGKMIAAFVRAVPLIAKAFTPLIVVAQNVFAEIANSAFQAMRKIAPSILTSFSSVFTGLTNSLSGIGAKGAEALGEFFDIDALKIAARSAGAALENEAKKIRDTEAGIIVRPINVKRAEKIISDFEKTTRGVFRRSAKDVAAFFVELTKALTEGLGLKEAERLENQLGRLIAGGRVNVIAQDLEKVASGFDRAGLSASGLRGIIQGLQVRSRFEAEADPGGSARKSLRELVTQIGDIRKESSQAVSQRDFLKSIIGAPQEIVASERRLAEIERRFESIDAIRNRAAQGRPLDREADIRIVRERKSLVEEELRVRSRLAELNRLPLPTPGVSGQLEKAEENVRRLSDQLQAVRQETLKIENTLADIIGKRGVGEIISKDLVSVGVVQRLDTLRNSAERLAKVDFKPEQIKKLAERIKGLRSLKFDLDFIGPREAPEIDAQVKFDLTKVQIPSFPGVTVPIEALSLDPAALDDSKLRELFGRFLQLNPRDFRNALAQLGELSVFLERISKNTKDLSDENRKAFRETAEGVNKFIQRLKQLNGEFQRTQEEAKKAFTLPEGDVDSFFFKVQDRTKSLQQAFQAIGATFTGGGQGISGTPGATLLPAQPPTRAQKIAAQVQQQNAAAAAQQQAANKQQQSANTMLRAVANFKSGAGRAVSGASGGILPPVSGSPISPFPGGPAGGPRRAGGGVPRGLSGLPGGVPRGLSGLSVAGGAAGIGFGPGAGAGVALGAGAIPDPSAINRIPQRVAEGVTSALARLPQAVSEVARGSGREGLGRTLGIGRAELLSSAGEAPPELRRALESLAEVVDTVRDLQFAEGGAGAAPGAERTFAEFKRLTDQIRALVASGSPQAVSRQVSPADRSRATAQRVLDSFQQTPEQRRSQEDRLRRQAIEDSVRKTNEQLASTRALIEALNRGRPSPREIVERRSDVLGLGLTGAQRSPLRIDSRQLGEALARIRQEERGPERPTIPAEAIPPAEVLNNLPENLKRITEKELGIRIGEGGVAERVNVPEPTVPALPIAGAQAFQRFLNDPEGALAGAAERPLVRLPEQEVLGRTEDPFAGFVEQSDERIRSIVEGFERSIAASTGKLDDSTIARLAAALVSGIDRALARSGAAQPGQVRSVIDNKTVINYLQDKQGVVEAQAGSQSVVGRR